MPTGVYARKKVPIELRFWSKVDRQSDNECWEWLGSTNQFGYGRFVINYQRYVAHRISYWLIYGGISKENDGNICVLHHCDNPSCMNPSHLFLGTKGDNNTDRHSKGRTKLPNVKGENHGSSKLNDEQVIDIRNLYKSGEYNQKEIGNMFGVSQQTISMITTRQYWNHLED